MSTSTTRSLSRFRYSAVLVGALAVFVFSPAAAFATDNEPNPGGGGCTYTDADGYDIPIDEGQDVFVDGKLVSCRGGSIVVTTPPKAGVRGVRPQLVTPNLPVFAARP